MLDLGPPALDELHDLLDLQLGEVEVVGQYLLAQLREDGAVDALAAKHAHRLLRQANETQAGGHLLHRERAQLRRGPPLVARLPPALRAPDWIIRWGRRGACAEAEAFRCYSQALDSTRGGCRYYYTHHR